jgi:hypothetical protein
VLQPGTLGSAYTTCACSMEPLLEASSHRTLWFNFPVHIKLDFSSSPHSCYTIRPSHLPRLDHSNYTWRRVQIIVRSRTQTMEFVCCLLKSTNYEAPRYAVFPTLPSPLRPKYSPQHPVLKHPQSMFLPYCQRLNLKPIQNHRQKYSLVYSDFYVFF